MPGCIMPGYCCIPGCITPGYIMPGYYIPGYITPGYCCIPGYIMPGCIMPGRIISISLPIYGILGYCWPNGADTPLAEAGPFRLDDALDMSNFPLCWWWLRCCSYLACFKSQTSHCVSRTLNGLKVVISSSGLLEAFLPPFYVAPPRRADISISLRRL